MGTFIKGDIVIVPFPFSDLSNSKKRPALVLAKLRGDDLILSQITSKDTSDSYSIKLGIDAIKGGTLDMESNIRPNKIFTADSNIVIYKVGSLAIGKLEEVINKVIEIFTV
ncbi:MAG: type II toxin-antitoxin system PemK/MazF family toxin [Firmicutes bacterium]|nr:type II toxin-antitoxin system PemK/MazF family toxin [Bacillota bacterium]